MINFDENDIINMLKNLNDYDIIDLFSDNMDIYKYIIEGLLYN